MSEVPKPPTADAAEDEPARDAERRRRVEDRVLTFAWAAALLALAALLAANLLVPMVMDFLADMNFVVEPAMQLVVMLGGALKLGPWMAAVVVPIVLCLALAHARRGGGFRVAGVVLSAVLLLFGAFYWCTLLYALFTANASVGEAGAAAVWW